ncbi:hypothetical protein LXL04_020063 [Taraxacum kok-saghyz]
MLLSSASVVAEKSLSTKPPSLSPSSANNVAAFNSSHHLLQGTVFVIVQALIYLIRPNSSDVFSKTKMARSFSSVSIRRMFAAIADIPAGGEASPSSSRRGFPFS